MPLLYKTLFEVKLLHEYYLTRQDGSTIFEKNDQNDRLSFLQEEFTNERKSIDGDITFHFPDTLSSIYEGVGLKILPTYSGCKILLRVNKKILIDGTIVYEPFTSFPSQFNIYIMLEQKGHDVDAFTNARIERPFSSTWFFSNDDFSGEKTYPYLTNSISSYIAQTDYEQGELSVYSSDIQMFNKTADSPWSSVVGKGFANENDRLLLPGNFMYAIKNMTNLTQITFTLKDKSGNTIAEKNEVNQAGISKKISIDFRSTVTPLSSVIASDYVYTLEVTGNNGYNKTHKIIFGNDLLNSKPWAVINITTNPTNTDFALFDNEGFLIKRTENNGNIINAPVFEIPFKSKLIYLRFLNDRGKELELSPALKGYLDKEPNTKILITKKPRSLARHCFLLFDPSPEDPLLPPTYAPNHVNERYITDSKQRICADIIVAESDMFPIV